MINSLFYATASSSFSGRVSPHDLTADIYRLANELRRHVMTKTERKKIELGDPLQDLREELMGHHPISGQEPSQQTRLRNNLHFITLKRGSKVVELRVSMKIEVYS
ncbi:hypothetical protein F5880DRAFT_1619815 [Lentinula raphanica]|nr:hypothetical protein F5880DRAFT_1619815 [Lentinula raphanica]